MKREWLLSGVLSLLAAFNGAANASDDANKWEDDDHSYDRARRAVDRGEILPMAQLLTHLHRQLPGEVVAVELEYEHGTWVYEFKVIDTRGRLIELYLDAGTGAVLAVEED